MSTVSRLCLASLLLAAATAHADSLDPAGHCVAPWGIDWNEVLGVDDASIVAPFCGTVSRGDVARPFTPEVLWITNTPDGIPGGPVIYPRGYRPENATPILDFVGKLERVIYVVHPGGDTISYDGRSIGTLVTVGELYEGSDELTEPQMVWPAFALLGRLPAPPVGAYSVDVHLVMRARHCDGNGAVAADNCLEAGDTLVKTRDFRVTR